MNHGTKGIEVRLTYCVEHTFSQTRPVNLVTVVRRLSVGVLNDGDVDIDPMETPVETKSTVNC